MQFVNWLKQRHLVIDWHNYGASMVSKRLGERSIFTRLVDAYERFWGYKATIHVCVSRAMARQLLYTYEKRGKVATLYDRAPEGFRQLNVDEIHSVSSMRIALSQGQPSNFACLFCYMLKRGFSDNDSFIAD